MERVAFTGEFAGEIRIAFPVADFFALQCGGRTAAAVCESAMGERVGEDVAQRFLEIGAAGEVAALMGWVAPDAVFGPVPGGDAQFGVVAVADGSPAGRERFFDDVRRVDFVDAVMREDIDGAAERAVGIERIDGVPGSRVDAHGRDLRRERYGDREQGEMANGHQMYAMTSISTSEFPGMPPAAAMVVRTGGSSPKRPWKTAFISL